MTTINITRAQRTCWHPDDEKRVAGMVIIGRAVVEIDGRDKIEGLVVASADPRELGRRFVQFFEPWTSRIVLRELP